MLFPWYTKYPYQNDEVLNLDWVLKTIDNLVKEVADFVTLNTIKYADPIQWNITKQYEKNTVVIDPLTGSAYISTQPVPAGVGLNNTDYWNIIFTLDIISANKNITLRDDANNMLATFESVIGDWVLWNGTLYVVTKDIDIGQAYVVDYNIERATVEYFLKLYINNLRSFLQDEIGTLTNLDTEVKTDLVSAINSALSELKGITGTLTDLDTEDKSNLVAAINELIITISSILSKIGNLNNLNTSEKGTLVGAINEVNTNIGELTDLHTRVKTSVVGAINDLHGDVFPAHKRILTVGAEGCDFTSISAAITAAKAYSSQTSRTAIIITGGNYNEQLELTGNCGIDLIGVGMPKVSYSATYPYSPLNCDGQIFVSGIYFINSNSSGSAYSMHYEGQSDNVSNADVYVKNCIFVSNAGAALGYGSGIGTTARFENCYFVTNNSNVSPIYLHNRPQGSTNLQSMEFVDCEFRSAGSYAMLVDNSRAMAETAGTSPLRLTFIGCSAGAGKSKVNYRYDSNNNSNFIPNTGEIYVSNNSTDNDILGVNYGKQEYTNITRSIVMPYHADTSGDYIRCDFIVPFEATQYYRQINSVTCNGVDVTSSFSVESGNINTNKVGLVTTASNVKGRYIFVNMSFSLNPFS